MNGNTTYDLILNPPKTQHLTAIDHILSPFFSALAYMFSNGHRNTKMWYKLRKRTNFTQSIKPKSTSLNQVLIESIHSSYASLILTDYNPYLFGNSIRLAQVKNRLLAL
jgi:hypothetical protein